VVRRCGSSSVQGPHAQYIPRTKFVDFLLYVPRGTEKVYVIPRGLLEYNTTWSEPKMTTYRHAWHLLQGTSPELFGRRFAHLSPWLRRLISGLEARDVSISPFGKGKEAYKRPDISSKTIAGERTPMCDLHAQVHRESTAHSPVAVRKSARRVGASC
jgi:hypothetical protein